MSDEPNKLASVTPIRDKINWNAHAALGDALNRCPIDADLMVVWMDKDGQLRWSRACDPAIAVYMMNAAIWKVTFE